MAEKFPNLKKYLAKLQDTESQLNPIYVRNFREIIKLVPLVGSWIDANTIGTIQDAKLQTRLNELESACAEALTVAEAEELLDRVVRVNQFFFGLLTSYQEQMFAEHKGLLMELRGYLPAPKGAKSEFTPNARFRFVVLSGASASGKDVLLDYLLKRLSLRGASSEVLTKFTTRPKRHSDSHYYQFLTEPQFDRHLSRSRIVFPYYKRRHRYGFDKGHLVRASRTEELLFAVFTEFHKLPMAKQWLIEQGISATLVLLEAPQEHLVQRSWFRSLPEEDVHARIESIEQDLGFLKTGECLLHNTFDHRVYNGDDRSKLDAVSELLSIVTAL